MRFRFRNCLEYVPTESQASVRVARGRSQSVFGTKGQIKLTERLVSQKKAGSEDPTLRSNDDL